MADTRKRIVIDALPHGPLGPWAWQRVGEATSLARLVSFVAEAETGEVCVFGSYADTPQNLEIAAATLPRECALRVTSEPTPENAVVLRTDRVYDPARLRAALREGQSPESAVLWRLEVKSDLESAAQELDRRTNYQPVGRHWAWPPAREIAQKLVATRIRPNHVTCLAAATFLAAAALVAFAGMSLLSQLLTALLLAIALVLDTSDGHLARLQRTTSALGKWLDGVLDEFCDLMLHIAIAWSCYVHASQPLWLVIGMIYVSGKYMFMFACQSMPKAEACAENTSPTSAGSGWTKVVRAFAHADIRWHAWIVLAACGQLSWALVAYAAYYPIRTAALARHWVPRHG